MHFILSKLAPDKDCCIGTHCFLYGHMHWSCMNGTLIPYCSVDNQVYVLAATDNSSAIKWIEKLQVSGMEKPQSSALFNGTCNFQYS